MLQITAKTDYGLLLMVTLAEHTNREPVSLREISEARKLPYRFLSQIATPLRNAGLLEAKEGVQGGYSLSRAPEMISVGEIVRAIDGDIRLVRCLAHSDSVCPSEGNCLLPPFWVQISNQLNRAFDELSLAQLVTSSTTKHAYAAATRN